jgi:catechol 2,3-dioxygenase-like lactoylglutathione lyase family enzyme
MAYRFLLEVPARLTDAAKIAVERAGDAEVLLVRPSHGLGVDEPYVDLTVAAHSLRAIDSLFDWYESVVPPLPHVRIVLHGGERYPLATLDRARAVALIRRDQPWVERSIPKIGEHETVEQRPGFTIGPGAATEAVVIAPSRGPAGTAVVESVVTETELLPSAEPAGGLQIRAINYVLIKVNDLQKAEVFYQDFLGMTLLGRAGRSADGTLLPMPSDYSWQRALQTGDLATISFLANGPLVLAVEGIGIAYLVEQGALDLVSLGVDARTFATLKGEVLMRPFTILRSGVASFVFRDPFNINWEIAVVGSVPLLPV